MINTETGFWEPDLTPKQRRVYYDNHRCLLVSGPRKSGKTIGNCNKIVKHLWYTDYNGQGAHGVMIAKTQKSAKQGGTWEDLLNTVQEWVNADIGLQFTSRDGNGKPGPKTDNIDRTLYFTIRNYYGHDAKMCLFSLDYDEDVISKLSSTRFSLIYFPELMNFKIRKVFSAARMQLRMKGWPRELHLLLADTNPADEGMESWIYKVWYEERIMENPPYPDVQKDLGLVEIFLDDNPYITQADKDEIMDECKADPELYERWVNGRWVAGGLAERVFGKVFKPEIHCLGDVSAPDPENWQILLPSEHCVQLWGGIDLGEVNHGGAILEKVILPSGTEYWQILAELIYINEEISIAQYVAEFMELMDEFERLIGHKVEWTFWSDSDAINQFKAAIDGVPARQVYNESGGRIELLPVVKGPNSVMIGANLIKNLLLTHRLFVSRRCQKIIEMFRELRRSSKPNEFVRRTGNKYKHPFDAVRYPISMETAWDEQYGSTPQIGSGLVSVRK